MTIEELVELFATDRRKSAWPIQPGTELKNAVRLLRELHPRHDLAWHTICVTCAQIEALQERVTP